MRCFILAERYDIKKQWVIIAGDFNDTPGSAPLKPLLNNSGLFDTLAVANVSADQRWTYYFGNYILVYPKFKLFDKAYNSLSNADKIIVESPRLSSMLSGRNFFGRRSSWTPSQGV